MAPPLALPLKATTGHPCLRRVASRATGCVHPFLSAHLYVPGESLASTRSGEYSLFVVATAPKLTGSDELAMNFAAHVTIFKGLLTRFQTPVLITTSENYLQANFAASPNCAYPGPKQPGRAGGVVIFGLLHHPGPEGLTYERP